MQRIDRFCDQQLGRGLAQLVFGLTDRGESRREHGGKFDVVIADDTHVTRHAHPAFGQSPQHPEGNLVVDADDGRRAVIDPQELVDGVLGLSGRGNRVDRVLNDACIRVQSRVSGSPAHAAATLRALRQVQGSVDESNQPVTEVEQIAGCELSSPCVIDRHRAQFALIATPVQKHHERPPVTKFL